MMLATEDDLKEALNNLHALRHFIHPNFEGVDSPKAVQLWEYMEDMRDTLENMLLETIRGEYKSGEHWNEDDLDWSKIFILLRIIPDEYRCYVAGAKPETVNKIFGTKKYTKKQVIALFNVVSAIITQTKLDEWRKTK